MAQDDLTAALKERGLTGFYGLLPADQEALMMLADLVSADQAVVVWLEHKLFGIEIELVQESDPAVDDPYWCPQCGGEGEYQAACQECGGSEDGCDFCGYTGKVWLPCRNCPMTPDAPDALSHWH